MNTPRRISLFNRPAVVLLVALMAFLAGAAGFAQTNPDEEGAMTDRFLGSWKGVISVGGQGISTLFHLAEEDGELVATMDSPDQGAYGIPVARVTISGSNISLDIRAVAARYDAVLAPDGSALEGTFYQGGYEIPLVLERTVVADAPRRPQEPKPPFPYVSEDVVFRNEIDDIELAGTVTRPEGAGPFPRIVLVSGSGQQNRNEEIFGHKPFLVLADALTRAGIVVLRYDDRGIGGSGGLDTLGEATTEDFGRDAGSAVAFLRAEPYTDDSRIGVLGHSEGGLIASRLAAQPPAAAASSAQGAAARSADRGATVDFLVLMASPGVPGDQLMRLQWAATLRASGANQQIVNLVLDIWGRVYQRILQGGDRSEVAQDIRPMLQEFGNPKETVDAQVAHVTSPWWVSFLKSDPGKDLRQVTVPVLAICGDKDTQVPAEENLAGIRAALEAAPTQEFQISKMEGLNHLLQAADTGAVSEYGTIEQTISPDALRVIVEWVAATTL